MRSMFPEYFASSEEEIEQLWKTGFFVFDSNVLLNLYRYSIQTRTDWLKVLGALDERIKIPNQVIFEFLENRDSVIAGEASKFTAAISQFQDLESLFDRDRAHPYLLPDSRTALSQLVQKLSSELHGARQSYLEQSQAILDSLLLKLKNKILSLSDKDLKQFITEGRERYDQRIPPGYMDKSKESRKDISLPLVNRKLYGDYIVWKESIRLSLESAVPIILVTGDEKEDWWHIQEGKKIGPRRELLKEFVKETNGQVFLLYTPGRFLERAKQIISVSPESVAETNDIDQSSFFLTDGDADPVKAYLFALLNQPISEKRKRTREHIIRVLRSLEADENFFQSGNLITAFFNLPYPPAEVSGPDVSRELWIMQREGIGVFNSNPLLHSDGNISFVLGPGKPYLLNS